MTKTTGFNPYSIEAHYGLEMACYQVHRIQPQSVRISTHDPEIAKAVVRRLGYIRDGLLVESEQMADILLKSLGIRPRVVDHVEADVALVLFSRLQYAQPPNARHLVLLGHNSLSYKSLLYPRQIQDNVISQLRWMQGKYTIQERVGLYGPQFLIFWSLSMVAGQRLAPRHFQLGQQAMDRLYTTGLFWWMGYITVLVGQRRG